MQSNSIILQATFFVPPLLGEAVAGAVLTNGSRFYRTARMAVAPFTQ